MATDEITELLSFAAGHFGPEFTAWWIRHPGPVLGDELSPDQSDRLRGLCQSASQEFSGNGPRSLALARFVRRVRDSPCIIGDRPDGRPAALGEGDSLERALRELAWEAFPALFLSASTPITGNASSFPSLGRSEAAAPAVRLVTDERMVRSQLLSNLAIPETTHRSTVDTLLSSAWTICCLRGDPTPVAFAEIVATQLATLRAALQGQVVDVPHFIGFGGYAVSEPVPGTGLLRFRDNSARNVVDLREQLSDETGFVVETTMKYRVARRPNGRGTPSAAQLKAAQREIEPEPLLRGPGEFALRLSIGAALAATSATQLRQHEVTRTPALASVPVPLWGRPADPLGCDWVFHWRSPPFWGEPIETTADEAARWFSWSRRLCVEQTAPIQVALERIFTALAYDRMPHERLVDSVIAWENLAGDVGRRRVSERTVEVVARMVAAPASEQGVRGELRKLYSRRSTLVHGGDANVSQAAADASLEVALRGVRTMITDRTDLLDVSNRYSGLFPEAPSGPPRIRVKAHCWDSLCQALTQLEVPRSSVTELEQGLALDGGTSKSTPLGRNTMRWIVNRGTYASALSIAAAVADYLGLPRDESPVGEGTAGQSVLGPTGRDQR